MGRVADYEFSGASGGTDVTDSTAGAHHGSLSNGAQLNGEGDARFDGTNDYATIPADGAFGLSEGTIIIEFTQHAASAGTQPYGSSAAQTLFSVDNYGFGGGGHLSIYLRSDGQVGVRHQSDIDNHYHIGGSITPGVPASIGYSWGPNGTKLVVNGVEVASSTEVLDLAGGDYPIVIGASQASMRPPFDPNNLEGHFHGDISRVQIHDTAMARSDPVPCFAAGTLIATPSGERPIELLRPGDLVLTADDGPQPIRAVAKQSLGAPDLAARPNLLPIRIARGALGNRRDLIVSRQHALLLSGHDVLVRAIHLAKWGDGRFRIARGCRRIDYHHLLLDAHQIIFAEGAPAESLLPTWDGAAWGQSADAPTARSILSGADARDLLQGIACHLLPTPGGRTRVAAVL